MTSPLTPARKADLRKAARAAMKNAYAPYSGYRVGAALLCESGDIVPGCNIENASYGLSMCAERNAVVTAVSAGYGGFRAIAVAADGAMPWPCGACRQVLNEFAPNMLVIVESGDGETQELLLTELLPHSFRLNKGD